jgi:hypothetical protein
MDPSNTPFGNWRKSARSGENGGDCVEVAVAAVGSPVASVVAVRDSKDASGPILTFAPAAWTTFVATLGGNRS